MTGIHKNYDKNICEDYGKLCPIYRLAMGEMAVKLDFLTTNDEKKKVLDEFSKKYLMLPEYWRQRCILEGSDPERIARSHLYSIVYRSDFSLFKRPYLTSIECSDIHFLWKNESVFNLNETMKNYKSFEIRSKRLEQALTFPHRFLDKCFEEYEKYGAKPLWGPAKQLYKKYINSNLYDKFVEAELNDEKWFKCMKEVDSDYNVAIANFEYRLGAELKCSNKKIWNKYIQYLKDKNPLAELDVYRRFCRLFISDKEMRKEYLREIERIGKLGVVGVVEFWIDAVQFELDFGSLASAHGMLIRALIAVMGKSYQISELSYQENFITFKSFQEEFMNRFETYKTLMTKKEAENNYGSNFELPYETMNRTREIFIRKKFEYPQRSRLHFDNTFAVQNLSLPQPMIRHILHHGKAEVLQVLYFSCKFMFAQKQNPLCHKLIIDDSSSSKSTRFFQQSLILSAHKCNINYAKNLHITNELICGSATHNYFLVPDFIASNRRLLSRIIPKLHKCELKFLRIINQHFPLDLNFLVDRLLKGKEFVFLIKSGTLKVVKLILSSIFYENGTKITEDEIKAMLLKFKNSVETFSYSPQHAG